MAGGGGGGGGAIVSTEDPSYAMQAGNLSAQAAQQAAQQYQTGTVNAVQALNNQYAAALSGLQPAELTGVQALDQLNQYLGLSAYNPGNAPTAPTAPTLANLASQVTPSQITQWIGQNSGPIQSNFTTNANTQGNGIEVINPNNPNQAWAYSTGSTGNYLTQTSPAQFDALFGNTAGWTNTAPNFTQAQTSAAGSPTLNQVASQSIAQQNLPLAQQQYQTALTNYNTQLNAYNQEKGWYDQYQAAGPLSQAQITANVVNQPGFQAEQAQGINAIQNSASAKGLLGSGAVLKNLMNFGQQLEGQYYGNILSNLAKEATAGTSAATNAAALQSKTGDTLASLYASLGQNQANATLAGANAQANALLSAGQSYQEIGGGGNNLGSTLSGIGSLVGAASSLF